jgi:hypothetical protein
MLRECIALSFEYLPLPNPPLEIPDFPANPIFRKKHSQFVLEAFFKQIK